MIDDLIIGQFWVKLPLTFNPGASEQINSKSDGTF